jgi:hypothetical protein
VVRVVVREGGARAEVDVGCGPGWLRGCVVVEVDVVGGRSVARAVSVSRDEVQPWLGNES